MFESDRSGAAECTRPQGGAHLGRCRLDADAGPRAAAPTRDLPNEPFNGPTALSARRGADCDNAGVVRPSGVGDTVHEAVVRVCSIAAREVRGRLTDMTAECD